MTSSHLSERALQEAAESAALLPAPQIAHLHGCRWCQRRVEAYQHLFTAAAHLPPPAFDFDLAASVVAQLPRPRPAFPWVLSGVATLVLGMVAAFIILFGSVLVPVFQSLSTELGAGLMAMASLLVASQCLELLARHRRQMHLLTLS